MVRDGKTRNMYKKSVVSQILLGQKSGPKYKGRIRTRACDVTCQTFSKLNFYFIKFVSCPHIEVN